MKNKINTVLAIASIILIASLIPTDRGSAMSAPPPRIDPSERMLLHTESMKVTCSDQIRTVASQMGAMIETERASLSDKFGHIYRYDIFSTGDGAQESYSLHTIAVFWTRDCAKVKGTTYPMFDVGGLR